MENARRNRLGADRRDYLHAMTVMAPFAGVAAANPLSAVPTARSAAELGTISARNRMINDLDRPDLSRSPAAVRAVAHALDVAGIGLDEVATIDLYSCFPVAVAAVTDAFGLAADDPRGLTVTGGLPFFGGPGNDYSLHAIADTVTALRARPGTFGLVGANGGALHKYSAGVYSTRPAAWAAGDDAAAQAEVDAVHARHAPETVGRADGDATVETYTVEYERDGRPRGGVVVGRLRDGGRRFLSRVAPDDTATLAMLTDDDPLGRAVRVTSDENGNRVAAT